MFRMAALFIVERLKPWLMTYLASLVATQAPTIAPRASPRGERYVFLLVPLLTQCLGPVLPVVVYCPRLESDVRMSSGTYSNLLPGWSS